jgi:transposase-like protein
LCGLQITSEQVSHATADLDPMLAAWCARPQMTDGHLLLDARYEHPRNGRTVIDRAVLIAIGIDDNGDPCPGMFCSTLGV